MKLIVENFDAGIKVLTEASGSGEKKTYIEGIFMQADKCNRNNRIYPKKILLAACNKYFNEQVSTGRAVGELNHPESASINLDKVSHRIVDLRWEGNNVIGKAMLLNTPMGNIAKGLLDGGVKLGVSSRGMGSVESKGDVSYVTEDFMLATVDIVQDPSAPEAFVNGIMEGVEYFFQNGKIVEKAAKNAKAKLSKMTNTQIVEAQCRVFQNFLTEIRTAK